jgi:hypothetical protein
MHIGVFHESVYYHVTQVINTVDTLVCPINKMTKSSLMNILFSIVHPTPCHGWAPKEGKYLAMLLCTKQLTKE